MVWPSTVALRARITSLTSCALAAAGTSPGHPQLLGPAPVERREGAAEHVVAALEGAASARAPRGRPPPRRRRGGSSVAARVAADDRRGPGCRDCRRRCRSRMLSAAGVRALRQRQQQGLALLDQVQHGPRAERGPEARAAAPKARSGVRSRLPLAIAEALVRSRCPGRSERQLHARRQLQAAGQLLHLFLHRPRPWPWRRWRRPRSGPPAPRLSSGRRQVRVDLDRLHLALAVHGHLDHAAAGAAGRPPAERQLVPASRPSWSASPAPVSSSGRGSS